MFQTKVVAEMKHMFYVQYFLYKSYSFQDI
jgi:hypothetical protein